MDGLGIRCARCGYEDVTDAFDVLGADPGHVFCPECGHEIPIDLVDVLGDD